MRKRFCLCACLVLAAQCASADIAENFDNIGSLTAGGWALINNSRPLGTTGWFPGNPRVFPAYAGASDSYIAANFLNADTGGNISNWLITPEVSLDIPRTISFYTRGNAVFADRLELRLSTNGASTDVGTTDSSVGDFGILLLTINPALDPSGYPNTWTKASAAFSSGFAPGTEGRFAFRYFVPDTSVNGDYIGIDSVTVAVTTPEPASLSLLGLLVAGLALLRRRK
jgi:hypothetical protein